MAKKLIPTVNEIVKTLSKNKLLPVYFICGEDNYSIDNAVEMIIKAAEPLINSELDRETINAERGQSLSQIIDLALSYPFGGGKKIIIIKNFERINDKKALTDYLKSPAEFTILIIVYNSKISDISKEPYSILLEKKYLYEARIETGEELVEWLIKRTKEYRLNISEDNVRSLIEITGEDKNLLESQLQKISNFALTKKEISIEEIKNLASPTKQYSIFDLQDAMGRGDKAKSIEIVFNLLDSGQDIVVIINMISKFILTIAQMIELIKTNVNDNDAARKIQVSWFYYINCKKARYFMSDEKLINAARALLEADTAVKTTSTEHKNILIMLIEDMMK